MKNIRLVIGTAAIFAALAFTVIQSNAWKVKDDYAVKFKGGKVEGSIKGLIATINFNENDLKQSNITASIDATTINTGNGMMDKHAMSDDALGAKQFPTINFVSTAIEKTASGYEAIGKLTLKGKTNEIRIPFTFSNQTFNGTFSVVPKDYGVTRGGTPDVVEIELTIPVTQ